MSGLPAKVSLIVPVYNVEHYLGRCLESCREQTLCDLEMIFIDDGSTDRSPEMLRRFAEEDSRAIVIRKENGGVSSARNTGLDVAHGEYVMFLDADDYLAPQACERIWTEVHEEPTDIVIYGMNYFPQYPEPKLAPWLKAISNIPTERFYSFKPEILFKKPGGNPFIWRQAFSLELLNKNNIRFDQTIKIGEDMLFQVCAFPHVENISFISDHLYYYRVGRAGSAMELFDEKWAEKMDSHIEVLDRALTEWETQGILEKYSTDMLNWAVDYVVNQVFRNTLTNKGEYMERFYAVLEKHHMKSRLNKITKDRKLLLEKVK